MKPFSIKLSAARWATFALLAASAVGCSQKLPHVFIANQLPEVRITAAPIDTLVTCNPDPVRSCYALTVNWVGHDPDGRVARYLYTVNPPSGVHADTVWTETTESEARVRLKARREVPPNGSDQRLFEEPNVFVLKAIDNRGAEGPVTYRAFFSFTEAPVVRIIEPTPSGLLTPIVPPSVLVRWSGDDPDGVFTDRPVLYKFILLTPTTGVTAEVAASRPDTLRRFYAPEFAEWKSVGGDTTEYQFANLTPNQVYVFAITAFDEAGAYAPVFSLARNMLRFRVGLAGVNGPKITFFNEFFNYEYLAGSYCSCPEIEVFLELPAGQTITMNWDAVTAQGTTVRAYRWALDIGDVDDDTQRTNEQTDLSHWSQPSLNTTSVRLGPFEGGEEHRLYVEATDNVGLQSLGIVRFVVVQSSFNRKLLIVDDTRLNTDKLLPTGCVDRPKDIWPNAAEFDTFLYAIGDVPWRCYPDLPNGNKQPSRRGIFAGYPFDTIGTRRGQNDTSVRLAALGVYEHVIWINDAKSALNNSPGSNSGDPITSLRYMSQAGHVNSLAAYVKQGGKVWATGGGIATASNTPWNDNNNDLPGTTLFTITGARRELASGRFMYDFTHWQTSIGLTRAVARIDRALGRYRDRSDPENPWTLYRTELPAQLMKIGDQPRDTVPPWRSATDFAVTSIAVEYLHEECYMIEDVDPDPDIVAERSTLDTLYAASGGILPLRQTNAIMTYYHGPSIPQGFLFTGIPFWYLRRTHCQAMVDFVLQRMWNIPRNAWPTPRPRLAASSVEGIPRTTAVVAPPATSAAAPSGVARRVRVSGISRMPVTRP